jgi:hypothetical protein
MSIIADADSIQLFLERYESGDPLKDWYDESEVQEALAEACELILEHVISE